MLYSFAADVPLRDRGWVTTVSSWAASFAESARHIGPRTHLSAYPLTHCGFSAALRWFQEREEHRQSAHPELPRTHIRREVRRQKKEATYRQLCMHPDRGQMVPLSFISQAPARGKKCSRQESVGSEYFAVAASQPSRAPRPTAAAAALLPGRQLHVITTATMGRSGRSHFVSASPFNTSCHTCHTCRQTCTRACSTVQAGKGLRTDKQNHHRRIMCSITGCKAPTRLRAPLGLQLCAPWIAGRQCRTPHRSRRLRTGRFVIEKV